MYTAFTELDITPLREFLASVGVGFAIMRNPIGATPVETTIGKMVTVSLRQEMSTAGFVMLATQHGITSVGKDILPRQLVIAAQRSAMQSVCFASPAERVQRHSGRALSPMATDVTGCATIAIRMT